MKKQFSFLLTLFAVSAIASERCDLVGIRAQSTKLAESSQHFLHSITDAPAYKHLYREAARVQEEASRLRKSSQCTVAVTNFRNYLKPPYVTLEGKYLQAAHHYPDKDIERLWNFVDDDFRALERVF